MKPKANRNKSWALGFWRVALTGLGVLLCLLALGQLILFGFGTAVQADVTTRRIGGADDGRPSDQRYQWAVSYTFNAMDGAMYTGYATLRGSDLSVKTDRRVVYLPFAPQLNALESQTRPGMGQAALLGGGLLLIVVMNKKPRKKRTRRLPDEAGMLQGYDDTDANNIDETAQEP